MDKRISLNGKVDLVMQDLGRDKNPPWLVWCENKNKKGKAVGMSDYSLWWLLMLIRSDKIKSHKRHKASSLLRVP